MSMFENQLARFLNLTTGSQALVAAIFSPCLVLEPGSVITGAVINYNVC